MLLLLPIVVTALMCEWNYSYYDDAINFTSYTTSGHNHIANRGPFYIQDHAWQ
ncbi:Hypothetical protein [Corynebacterium glutamicum ATCC 13032]|uniref:Uncharacterized protein n=1 Tax=Corynebacterium glutamicum (strain ATCC 13032 / DSM 20300 / JCM 1318 / BCRC 11384 / CCUG 27702 / LMG 3730 / NBRC 12168 / NCIMB 10025 / NRRL B-2784 / 534) TaxID=196627 RepID=Q8NSB8_CORGL|nr:Hypothetical protein [Corynebacterium glutamicum ATCC 13032]